MKQAHTMAKTKTPITIPLSFQEVADIESIAFDDTPLSRVVCDAMDHYANNPPPALKGMLGDTPADMLTRRTYWVERHMLELWEDNARNANSTAPHMIRGALAAWVKHVRGCL